MPIAEKLAQKSGALKEKLSEKSQETENAEGVSIDSMEWLLLFMAAGYIDILFILLAIVGLIPYVGQVIYTITDPVINIIATGIFWFYLQNKGLGGYWWLAFGGGLAGLVPIVNWLSWVLSVFALYCLVKAEKIPFAGEIIEKAAKTASKNKMKILIKFFILLLAASCFPYSASAQFTLPTSQLPNLNMKPTLSLTVETQTPPPNTVVTATANLSGITNVNNSNFSWFLNGVAQKETSGVNKNVFILKVGGLGAIYKISLSVLTPGGDNLSDSISITVSDFDLTWNTDSQAPALYKGKLLPTQKSTLNISALPFVYSPGSKTQLVNNNLIFNWTIDDKFSAGSSGAGKSKLIFFVNDYAGGSKSIRLEIKTSDGAVSISKSIEIPIVRPQVFVRLADFKTGLPYGTALKNLIVGPISLNFMAQNYFFNATPDNLHWQWLIGGKEVESTGEKPWFASLNLADTDALFAQIKTIVKNSSNELETAQSMINLQVK